MNCVAFGFVVVDAEEGGGSDAFILRFSDAVSTESFGFVAVDVVERVLSATKSFGFVAVGDVEESVSFGFVAVDVVEGVLSAKLELVETGRNVSQTLLKFLQNYKLIQN
uniref:Uncharacterized protein n=1 Tax=Panagrolaimus superbus TaxID=310955 RepID=A0A914Y034_9BILA